MDKRELAKTNFEKGYNCAQSVLLAYAEELNIDVELALKIAAPFGGGMGRMREVCGAVSGMFMVAGLKCGYTDPSATTEKHDLYVTIQELAKEYKDINGSIICRELLGLSDTNPTPEKRTSEYYKKRPCAELCGDAAEIVSKLFVEK